MAFEIKFTCDAAKDVQRLDGSIKQKLKNTLNKKLAVDPDGYGTPLRAELENYYKHEFATHRIIYRIYPLKKLVVICAVGLEKVATSRTYTISSGNWCSQAGSRRKFKPFSKASSNRKIPVA